MELGQRRRTCELHVIQELSERSGTEGDEFARCEAMTNVILYKPFIRVDEKGSSPETQ